MAETPTQEVELVLLLAQPDLRSDEAARMLELLNSPVDWNLVLGMLTVHRVVGVAWHNYVLHAIANRHKLQCAYLMKSLGVTTAGQRVMAQEQISLTSDLQAKLTAAGIRSAVLKGGGVAAAAYPDLGMRAFHDNDILVDRSRLTEAQAVLREAGYVQGNWDYVTGTVRPAERRQLVQMAMSSHQTYSYMKPTPTASMLECHRVDLHFSVDLLTGNRSDAAVSALLDDCRDVAGMSVVSALDMLVFVCVHLARDAFHRNEVLSHKDLVLNKFTDVVCLMAKCDLDALPGRVEELGFGPEVYFALHYCDEVFPSRVPAGLLDRLRPSDLAYLDEVTDGRTVVHRWNSPMVRRMFDALRFRGLQDA
jgi:hypothetical protein